MRSLAAILLEAVLIAIIMLLVLMWGIDHGIKQGRKEALTTNPVSDELELVCAGLWVGEQNRKHAERSK